MSDPKRFAKDKLSKRAPKGVDPEKHERCVHDVKQQGHSVGSAHAICTSALKKDENGTEGEESVSTMDSETKQISGMIYRHNRKKLHTFVDKRKKKMKKSLDFKDTTVSIDAQDQHLAEKTTSPLLIEYIQNNLGVLKSGPGASVKIPFPTGTLTMSERESGVYHGHFQDRDGQIIEKFDSQTIAIIAKNLQIKSLVPQPVEPQVVPVAAPSQGDMITAAHDRIDGTHNRIDDLQRQLIEQQRGKSIKIKYGDFELEIKKSIQGFVSDFRAGRTLPDKDVVRKALTSWRKHATHMQLTSDQQAARVLMENWEEHQDSFCQFVDALSRGEDE